MTTGLVSLALCTVMLGVACGLVLCQAEIGRLLRGLRTGGTPEPAVGPPIEDTARALRRLRGQVLAPAPGTPMARRRGTTAAYDDLLVPRLEPWACPTPSPACPRAPIARRSACGSSTFSVQAGLRLD